MAEAGQLIASDHHGIYLHNVRGDVVQRVGIQPNNQNNPITILHTYLYDAFGNELNNNPDNTNPFRYAGEYYDWETQTYYLRARHFNPRTGRFTQPDPFWNISNMTGSTAAILQSGNLFVYTMHNPVMFVDPTGLWATVVNGSTTNPLIGGLASNARTIIHRPWDTMSNLSSNTSTPVASASFIFHCRDFAVQAQWQKEQILLNNPSAIVFLQHTPSAASFRYHWNNMHGRANTINNVFIFTHGHGRAIWFDDDSAITVDGLTGYPVFESMYPPRNRYPAYASIGELNPITVQGGVHLFSCNPGHLNVYNRASDGHNFASALSTRVNGTVTGFDGSVGFGLGDPLTYITGVWIPRLSQTQGSFFNIIDDHGGVIRVPRGVQQFRDGNLSHGQFMPIMLRGRLAS